MQLAQIAGIVMIILPSFILGGVFLKHALVAIMVAMATLIYFGLARFPFPKPHNSAVILHRLRYLLGVLVIFDIVVILGLIGISGGIFHSHLSYVLVLIPPILALVLGGRAAVFSICVMTASIIILEVLSGSLSLEVLRPTNWFSECLAGILQLQSGDPTTKNSYLMATSVGILTGSFLAMTQSYLASGDTLPEDVLYRITKKYENELDDIMEHTRLLNHIARSYHKTSRIVSLTNHPDLHCSLVHPIDDLIFQAYVLSLPAYHIRKFKGVEMMSNMVFAIHWIDDLFDGLGYHSFLQATPDSSPPDFQSLSVSDICKRLRPHGVERVVKLINGSLSSFQRFSFVKPMWPEGVETGLMRVILGGIIQASDDALWRNGAICRFKSDVQRIVEDEELSQDISQVSPAFLWSISKTDMPLVLSMFAKPEKESSNLGTVSLVLDALLMPLLLWHDLDEEKRREAVGKRMFHQYLSLDDALEAAVNDAVKILEAKRNILTTFSLWKYIKPMVKKVKSEFGDRIPRSSQCDDYKKLLAYIIK